MKLHLPSVLLYLGMLELRWLCIHLWLNLINWTIIDIKEKVWKSMYEVSGELLFSCGAQTPVELPSREGDIGIQTKLCKCIHFKWVIQICSNFFSWVSKIAFTQSTLMFGGTSPLITAPQYSDCCCLHVPCHNFMWKIALSKWDESGKMKIWMSSRWLKISIFFRHWI